MFPDRPFLPHSFPAWSMFVSGMLITVILFTVLRDYESDRVRSAFHQAVHERAESIEERVRGTLDALDATAQLFATFGDVDRAQFQSFTRPLLERYPYIEAFQFHRVIAHADLAAYQARTRELYPSFMVTEAENGEKIPVRLKQHYYVIDYVEPMKGNEFAFGLDLSANPGWMSVTREAVNAGEPRATRPSVATREPGTRGGFLVIMPVYRANTATTASVLPRSAWLGSVAAVLRVGDLIGKLPAASGTSVVPAMDISAYASSDMRADNLVFRYPLQQADESTTSPWLDRFLAAAPQRVVHQFDVAGQPWTLAMSAQKNSFAHAHSDSLLVLVGGFFLTLLVTAYQQFVGRRVRRSEQLVDQRTAQLKRANALLAEDIAARRRTEKALQLRERAIDASANAIVIINAKPPGYLIEHVNPALERMTGYAATDLVGEPFRVLQNDYHDQAGSEEICAALHEQRAGHATLRSYRKDGTLFWSDICLAPVRNDDGHVSHFVMSQYDITAIKRYEAELEYQSTRDGLTGLANRNLLRDRLNQAIAYAGRYGHAVWVIYVDLDRFKFVNDTLGHQAGDTLLTKTAERLQKAVRETDTVGRLGGDEFILVLPERNEEKHTVAAVQRLMDVLAQPIRIDEHTFFPTCSSGVATYPNDGTDTDTLVRNAEIAMYRAKESGRNNFQFYTSAMNAEALARLQLEGSLRQAVERDEFILHYQPQVDLQHGEVVGVEALIRWQHPELGMIQPARFISLAEETGLIVPIGAWVIRHACLQAQAWQKERPGGLRVAVNLSARQFFQHDLVQTVASALQESGLAPQQLDIELTESLVMTDVERAIAILRDLKGLGVQLSIDDFGTGYSSLSYLKRFPIDILKIDQSFVRDLTNDSDDAAIVVSIISLAHSLRLKVIAEGVETEEQLVYLGKHGCDQMQGYYFSKPVPPDAIPQLLAA